MSDSPNITATSWLAILLLGFVWGGTFLVIELALQTMTPFWIAAARIAFATLLTLVVWSILGRKLWLSSRQAWGSLIVVGIASSALPFMLLSWGLQYVTSGFAGVSMAAVALLVLPLSHFLVAGERMTLRKTLGLTVGFCGVVILIGGNAFTSTGSEQETLGRFACLGAAACYAVSSIVMRRLPAVDPIGLAAVPLVFGSLIVIPVAYASEGLPELPDSQTLLILAFLGLIPTAGANFLRVWIIRTAGPVFMSLTNYQVPIWSVLLGALVLSEALPSSLILSLTLILLGVGLTQYGPLTRLFTRS